MTVEPLHATPAIFPRRDILGTSVAVIGRDEAMDLLRGSIAERCFTKLTFLNAHNANVAVGDAAFRAALQDFLVLADGVGVDIASRMLYGEPFPDNLNGTDFVPAFLRQEPRALRVGLIGARRRNAQAAARRLAEIAPQHDFLFLHDGYFGPEDEPAILEAIAAARPDVLLVAMGVPRQELWIARNITSRHCTVPMAVGALLDFLSGAVPRAPAWMRRLRLEWLFRLGLEPRRLWRRYVVGNPLFLARVALQKFGRNGRS
ncbi:WecB/TagA/CpsF family glycosyltransferase [Nitratireductor sp. ZSWI3]|uniref:WecB/TagA/CpsF family glycosyltransferase n=1 Tax=Nitratireductor sp. ZSWI3 TaxID=2966359 RepID=UPI00214F8C22|nr:WecB/TagA/CpsF family glycosyltransferase [Nitratireductor sp. ZSWI3]MCR4268237.1 WecB/TagA/CpsF family glycosyltransferase [Nitratireductor sp. ZSWI3]